MNAIMVLANKEAESLTQLRTPYHSVAIRENIFCNNLKVHKHEYFVGLNLFFNIFIFRQVLILQFCKILNLFDYFEG
jgi:hypothetical protein